MKTLLLVAALLATGCVKKDQNAPATRDQTALEKAEDVHPPADPQPPATNQQTTDKDREKPKASDVSNPTVK